MKRTLLTAILLLTPAISEAQFSSLIDSPLGRTGDIGEFLNEAYILLIVAAATLAVIKIIIAGVKYMVSDVVPTKEGAKKDIYTSLFGLVIVLGAVVVLQTINPSLTDFDLRFEKPERVDALRFGSRSANSNPTASLQTANQTLQQQHQCLSLGERQANANGTAYTIRYDASGCGSDDDIFTVDERDLATLAADQACSNNNGIFSLNTETGVGICTVGVTGTITTNADLSEVADEFANVHNGVNGPINGSNVTQSGQEISVDIEGACTDATNTLTGNTKSVNYDECLRELPLKVRAQCKGAPIPGSFGFYGRSLSSASDLNQVCELPTRKVAMVDMTDAFNNWVQADPARRKNKTLGGFTGISASDEKEICEGEGGEYFDELGTNNTCAFYD